MRHAIAFAGLSLLLIAGCKPQVEGPKGISFALSFPENSAQEPQDGRLILLLSRDMTREPRTHASEDEVPFAPYMFGMNVEGMAPGKPIDFDAHAFGWPAASMAALPPGDYYVQAVLNRYETFHLADGRVLKLPPEKGEGQQWAHKPGNLGCAKC